MHSSKHISLAFQRMPLYPKLRALLCFPKTPKTQMPDLDLILNQQTFVLYFPFVCNIRPSVISHVLALLEALGHTLVHESEEADGAGADAHAVDEAAGEERAEDGAEVGVGDL
jgi:hypothetical protein